MFNQIFDAFVNPDLPCPEEIPFCSEWRAKYLEELQKAKAGGCSKCKELSIKSHYMQIVYRKYMDNLKANNKI